jgi:hypothetical protein
MRLLCTDEDTSDDVCRAMRKLRPAWDIVFVREWAGAGVSDAVLLDLLWSDRRALISRDRRTLPVWLKHRQAQGLDHAGVFFWDMEHFPPGSIGALARASVQTVERHRDLINVIDTIR